VFSQNHVRSIEVNRRCCHVIYFTNFWRAPSTQLIKSAGNFFGIPVGKRVETSDRIKVELTKHRESCPRDQYFNVLF
jgi:hypothetical protein